jgi:hypothetical protein
MTRVPGLRRRLLDAHRDLRAQAADREGWPYTRPGADLWIDGLTALRSTSRRLFAAYLDAFLDYAARTGLPAASPEGWGLAAALERFDAFLEGCAEQGETCFWHALTVGLCLVQAQGGPPRLEGSGAVVINDTLLTVLSPSYRSLRFTAFNTGARTLTQVGRKPPVFRPELNLVVFSQTDVVDAEPRRVQFYVANHELSHLVLFADAYLRPVGTPAMTASLLLNAEETACNFDLVLAAELLRFGAGLHAFREMRRMEKGWREEGVSVMERAGRSPEELAFYQRALKAAAQLHLETPSLLSSRIAQAPVPADLQGWFRPAAQKMHAIWHEGLAVRVWNPHFQRLVSLLPPLPGHLENLHRFARETWKVGQRALEGPIPEPAAALRERNVLLHRLRFLVIRGAELAARMAKDGAPAEPFLDDLTGWALSVVEDVARLQRPEALPEVAERLAAHRAAACALLGRYALGEEARRFDDPIAAEAA